MSEASKYNFPNAQKVQVFEQVDTYIENQNNVDLVFQQALGELQRLISYLQSKYPSVTTEVQAANVIASELPAIEKKYPGKLATLRKQLLNPERHLKATKATLAEITKHYLEDSLLAKATITYFDTMSADPGQGV
jgi:hypothetical protein